MGVCVCVCVCVFDCDLWVYYVPSLVCSSTSAHSALTYWRRTVRGSQMNQDVSVHLIGLLLESDRTFQIFFFSFANFPSLTFHASHFSFFADALIRSRFHWGHRRSTFQNFPMCHPPLFPLVFFFCLFVLHFNYTLDKVQELKFVLLHPVPVTVSALRCPSLRPLRTWSFLCGLFFFSPCCGVMHQWIRSVGWAALQAPLWVLWDRGWWDGGWESGAHCGGAAELFMPPLPTLPASIPLCSASTETCITLWMNDLCLSPSLNLKWSAFCWFFFFFLPRYSHHNIPENITAAEIGLKSRQNFRHKEKLKRPEVISPSLLCR